MRRFANGQEWDVVLPYEGDSHWNSFGGATYLTDRAILLKLIEVTDSDEEPAEFLARAGNTLPIDLAKSLPDHLWQDFPKAVPVVMSDHDGVYRLAQVGSRMVDLEYLSWLTKTFRPVRYAIPAPGREEPVYFAFDRGWALLMPMGDLDPVRVSSLACPAQT